jgi:hypothetical protein
LGLTGGFAARLPRSLLVWQGPSAELDAALDIYRNVRGGSPKETAVVLLERPPAHAVGHLAELELHRGGHLVEVGEQKLEKILLVGTSEAPEGFRGFRLQGNNVTVVPAEGPLAVPQGVIDGPQGSAPRP